MKKLLIVVALATLTLACQSVGKGDVEATITSNIISDNYIGNGVQWDPYSRDFGIGRELTISEKDWKKLYDRVDNMRPGFIRLMFNTAQLIDPATKKFDKMRSIEDIARILDYCQSRGVNVMFGDWGGAMTDPKAGTINEALIKHAVEYADFLINERGYSCIKFYNLINEPNGWWSITKGDYSLWARAVRLFHTEMVAAGLGDKLSIVGPDIAIWDETEDWWIDSCAMMPNGTIGLYDIHTYPGKGTVNSGRYSEIIRSYREKVPTDKQMVMGEIGLKFHDGDPYLDSINKARIARVPHASQSDSQMFVFDHFYGVDMADVLIQTLNEGLSGSIIWMLDDAMHTNPVDGPGKLKIWGFWNILGDEYFGGAEHEKVRPPYYAWSLVSRYVPSGSTILKCHTVGDKGIKMAVAEHDGSHTIILINVSDEAHSVDIKSTDIAVLRDMRQYNYIEGDMILEGDNRQLPNAEDIKMNLKDGYNVELPSQSMIVYTNMN